MAGAGAGAATAAVVIAAAATSERRRVRRAGRPRRVSTLIAVCALLMFGCVAPRTKKWRETAHRCSLCVHVWDRTHIPTHSSHLVERTVCTLHVEISF